MGMELDGPHLPSSHTTGQPGPSDSLKSETASVLSSRGPRLQNSVVGPGALASIPLLQVSPGTWRVPWLQRSHKCCTPSPPKAGFTSYRLRPGLDVEGRLSEGCGREGSGLHGVVLQVGYLAPFVLFQNKKNSS